MASPPPRKTARYYPGIAQAAHGVPEALMEKRWGQWLAAGFLTIEMVSTKTKRQGLRVLRRLSP